MKQNQVFISARSPIYSHLSVAMEGHLSIKASGKESMIMSRFHAIQNTHSSAYNLFINTWLWMGVLTGIVTVVYLALVLITGFAIHQLGNIEQPVAMLVR